MEREIGYAAHLTIEIIVAALLLAIATPLCVLSYRAYGVKLQEDGAVANVQAMAKLSGYNNKEVHYEDALELILTNTRNYEYVFTTASGDPGDTVTISKEKERIWGSTNNTNSLEYWNYANLLQMTDSYSDANMTATLIKSADGLQVIGVQFTVGG